MVCSLLAVLGVYLAHTWHFKHYVNDDAYITLRYSRFVAMGRGPYFNIGERVEGYSNLLLMLLMVPVIAVGGEGAAAAGAKIIGVVCGGLSLVAAFALCRLSTTIRLPPSRAERASASLAEAFGGGGKADTTHASWIAGVLAAGVIAVSPSYALNTMSGLETTLFGLCLTGGVLLGAAGARQGAWRGAGLAFAGGVLSRPEGSLVFGVYWLAQALSSIATRTGLWVKGRWIRSPLAIDAAIVTAVFAVQLAFRWIAYDGDWLPNTYYAKSGGFWKADAWEYVHEGIFTPLGGTIAVLIGSVGCFPCRRSHRWIVPAAATVLAGVCLPFLTGTDWMPGQRLLMPYLPLAAALMATGWCRVAGTLIRKPSWAAPSLALLLLPALWISQGPGRAALFDESSIRARGYKAGHFALADWLCSSVARPGDTIALMDTGIIGYRCIDQRILDITGLTDRFIARSPGEFLAKEYDAPLRSVHVQRKRPPRSQRETQGILCDLRGLCVKRRICSYARRRIFGLGPEVVIIAAHGPRHCRGRGLAARSWQLPASSAWLPASSTVRRVVSRSGNRRLVDGDCCGGSDAPAVAKDPMGRP